MTKIIQRHDTAANWTAANPVLAAGEMGVEYQEGTVTFTLSDAVTTNGTPTFNNGLVSNFSTSSYYSMNTMFVEEMVIQFTTGSDIVQGQYISTYPSLNIENGKLRLGLPSGFQQLMTVSASTQYTIKVINYSSKIEVYSSSTLIATFDTSLSSGGPRFGSNTDGYPFLGTIDFRNTSINGASLTNKTEVFSGTSRFKFGNGTSAWSELSYATSGSGGTGGGTQLTSSDGATEYSTLALGDNLVVDTGDIAWTNPTMTSNSQNGYVLSASHTQASEIYMAFNRDTTTGDNAWYSGGVGYPQWIMMECPEAVRLTSCTIMNEIKTPENFKNAEIQGSNDGNSFDTLYTITGRPNTSGYSETYNFTNNNYYKYLRLYFTSGWTSGVSLQNVEFNGFLKDPSAVPSLNVNLDELGNEVNTLASAVAGKQDKLTAKAPLKIAEEGVKKLNGIKEYQSGGTLTEDCVYSLNPNMASGPGLTTTNSLPLSTASNWEIVVRIELTSATNSIARSAAQAYGFEFGRKDITLSTTGKIWDYVQNVENTTNSLVGQTLFMRYQFSGTKYTIGYSSDDITYTALANFVTSRRIHDQTIEFILFSSPTNYNNGKVYLADSYYKIDGVKYPFVVEHGKLTISSNIATTSSTGVVQPDGTSITISDTGVISGQDVKTFTGYSDTGTLVLKSINGVLQWVAE